jgi:hypothetical protein
MYRNRTCELHLKRKAEKVENPPWQQFELTTLQKCCRLLSVKNRILIIHESLLCIHNERRTGAHSEQDPRPQKTTANDANPTPGPPSQPYGIMLAN